MIKAQVVIIGGGVMGVSLLYHLVKAGWQDAMLIEKNDLTHGSTWHAAGLCTHFAHNPTIQELRATSVRLYRDTLPEETGETCGFHRSGAMRITHNPDRMDEFAHVAGLSDFTGYPLEILTPERIAELHPLARLDGLLGGIYEPDDGHVDPTLATQAMAKVATGSGAVISRHNAVRATRWQQDHWIVESDRETVQCQHLVNAAGTWGWEVGDMMGINIPSVPILHQYLVTDTVPAVHDRIKRGDPELPIIRDPEESWYVRQEHDGLILGPYEKAAQPWSVDGVPSDFGADLLPPDLDRVEPIIEAALARIPAIGDGGIKTVINGPITFTPDANPLIGPAHGLTNAWLLTGSSMGVMEGGGAGWFLAHWMTQGAPPMDAIAVDSRRFGAWADRSYRIEKAVECFGLQFGVHYPFEERPAARNVRLSPLHQQMLDRGAVMGFAHGHERPNWFSQKTQDRAEHSFRRCNWFKAVADEIDTVTHRVALADLSVFSKFRVTGPDTSRFLETLGTNRAPSIGRVNLNYVLTPAGGICSEFTVAMTANHEAYLTSAAAAEEHDYDVLTAHAEIFDVVITNKTDQLACIALMGPHAADVLGKLLDTTSERDQLESFMWLENRHINLSGISVLALKISYIGESGWELHVQADKAAELFLQLEEAGKPFGIGYYGAFAANSMRLEKGYAAWGVDLTTERTPLESGLERLVRSDQRDFVGRDLMLQRQTEQPWCQVLLEIETADVDPFYAHTVFRMSVNKDPSPVGMVTSGTYGHRCKQTLALCLLRDTQTISALKSGDFIELAVSILGKHRKARVLEQIPFDPENQRLKS